MALPGSTLLSDLLEEPLSDFPIVVWLCRGVLVVPMQTRNFDWMCRVTENLLYSQRL
jgi:hypothetical protein